MVNQAQGGNADGDASSCRRGKLFLAFATVASATVVLAAGPADFVNPFVGTSATGHTFPGACAPFGLVQASPDTGNGTWDYCSGYRFEDKAILGFSQTHLNGTGAPALGDVLIQPFSASDLSSAEKAISGYRYVVSTQDKSAEIATPGYYAATLADFKVRAEVAATAHVAFYRLTYNGDGPARLLVDTQYGLGCDPSKQVFESDVRLTERTGLCGTNRRREWIERRCSFSVVFDHAHAAVQELPGWPGERAPRYVFDFDLKRGEPLLVKIALSAGGGVEDARKNLAAELPGWDFESARAAARRRWNDLLGRVAVEGTDDQKRNFYTSLYHLYTQPNDMADVGQKPFYSTFSCWDTFRAAGPLYTITCPERAAEFVDSLLEQGRSTGYLPIWTLWGKETQSMIGTHSIPMIVDAYLKGVWPVDSNSPGNSSRQAISHAYRQVKETLTQKHVGRTKENWDFYDRYGYYPFDLIKGESVSRTLECAYDDWCAGKMAERLGHRDDAAFFFRRAAYWKNVYDPSLGMVRGKDTKGMWRTPFDPFALGHGAGQDNDFTEGNAFQYTWHVMQDVPGLVAAMGGRDKFVARLDSLFKAPSKTEGMGEVVDVTGLIGQYVHGNEPSHHIIYFYPQVGHPEKAAARIREVFDKFYLPKPDGLCGNDDCGQMSAWYLFSAMGFYPFNPCGGEYVIGAPQVPKVSLKLATGRTFVITALNLSRENRYVKSVTLNGKPKADWKIRHEDVVAGGDLVFEMTGLPRP